MENKIYLSCTSVEILEISLNKAAFDKLSVSSSRPTLYFRKVEPEEPDKISFIDISFIYPTF